MDHLLHTFQQGLDINLWLTINLLHYIFLQSPELCKCQLAEWTWPTLFGKVSWDITVSVGYRLCCIAAGEMCLCVSERVGRRSMMAREYLCIYSRGGWMCAFMIASVLCVFSWETGLILFLQQCKSSLLISLLVATLSIP